MDIVVFVDRAVDVDPAGLLVAILFERGVVGILAGDIVSGAVGCESDGGGDGVLAVDFTLEGVGVGLDYYGLFLDHLLRCFFGEVGFIVHVVDFPGVAVLHQSDDRDTLYAIVEIVYAHLVVAQGSDAFEARLFAGALIFAGKEFVECESGVGLLDLGEHARCASVFDLLDGGIAKYAVVIESAHEVFLLILDVASGGHFDLVVIVRGKIVGNTDAGEGHDESEDDENESRDGRFLRLARGHLWWQRSAVSASLRLLHRGGVIACGLVVGVSDGCAFVAADEVGRSAELAEALGGLIAGSDIVGRVVHLPAVMASKVHNQMVLG